MPAREPSLVLGQGLRGQGRKPPEWRHVPCAPGRKSRVVERVELELVLTLGLGRSEQDLGWPGMLPRRKNRVPQEPNRVPQEPPPRLSAVGVVLEQWAPRHGSERRSARLSAAARVAPQVIPALPPPPGPPPPPLLLPAVAGCPSYPLS